MALNCFKSNMDRNIRYMISLKSEVSKQVKTFYIQNTLRKHLLSACAKVLCQAPKIRQLRRQKPYYEETEGELSDQLTKANKELFNAPVISHLQEVCNVRVIWLRNWVRTDFRGRDWFVNLHTLAPESNTSFLAT